MVCRGASDPASVLGALELGDGIQANWASGLSAAYQSAQGADPWVFVSPPVSGWIFVLGSWLPYPVAPTEPQHEVGRKFDVLLARLMKQFADVQFFGSYRVVGFAAWVRAQNGERRRVFAFADGEVYANAGDQTPEEAKLKLVNLSGLSPSAARDRIFEMANEQEAEQTALVAQGLTPREARARVRQNSRSPIPGEQDVVDLAALWSVDPSQLEHHEHPPALGLAARLPKNLMQ
jgi:hypothetical protein